MLGQAPAPPAADVRLAIVGCGRMAQRGHVPAAERAGGVELVAVADHEPARCAQAAPEVAAYGSIEELLAAEQVEALVIATPTDQHVAGAKLAARSGIAALVEKPPAQDAAGAAELAGLSPPVRIGFNRRFDPELDSLRRRLSDCAGATLELGLSFPIMIWRPYMAHDDALLDLGAHMIDLARWLTGTDLARVRSLEQRRARVSLELELGEHRARVTCSANRFWQERVVVRDPDGARVASQLRGGLLNVGLARLGLRSRDDGFVDSLAHQLEAFAAELRWGAEAELATAQDGVAALAGVDAARASARAGGEWLEPATPMPAGPI